MQLILTAVDDALTEAWQQFCGGLEFVQIHRGSILDVPCDAAVSPANSFGFMDGGIDALYVRHFGPAIQERVQTMIRERHDGELLVGSADVVETGDGRIPNLIVAPTMRVPMILRDSVNPYLAARAVFLQMREQPALSRVAMPGLGTGVGQISPSVCAHQVRQAIDDVMLRKFSVPRSWAEASERHQLLYTDRPRRLQQA
jgi:O-acetyl-ADP-ribose deacetylase (regulator of RNase III)